MSLTEYFFYFNFLLIVFNRFLGNGVKRQCPKARRISYHLPDIKIVVLNKLLGYLF